MKKTFRIKTYPASLLSALCFFLFVCCNKGLAQQYDPEVWKVQPWVKQSTLDKGLIGGEGGQWGLGIAIDEVDGNLMFLTTDVGGIWRSVNAGATWGPANAGLYSRGASAIAIDPNNINRVIVVGGNGGQGYQNQHGIYLSTNKGDSWNLRLPLSSYCGFRDNREHITFDKASLDPVAGYSKVAYWSRSDNGGNCQSGTGPFVFPGLYKSMDGGSTWSKLPNSDSLGTGIVKTNPVSGHVYLANKRGFFKSTNGGVDFLKTFTGNVIYMSAPGLANPDKIYLLTQSGLLRSDNGGDSFQPVASNNFPSQYTPSYLNVSPVNNNKMILQIKRSTFDDVRYYTQDGGLTWQQITVDKVTDNFLPYNNGLTLYSVWHPVQEDVVWTFGSNILLKSSDGGKNFAFGGDGVSHTFVSAGINWSTTHPGVLATPTQDWNSAVTADGGKTWKYLPVSGFGFGGYNYGAYSSNGRVAVVGNVNSQTSNGGPRLVTVTRDGGQSWDRTSLAITGKEVGYGDPHDSTILFLGNYRSIDEGLSWNNMAGCDGVFTSSPTGAKELYGVKGRNIVRSNSRGASWTTIGSIPDNIQDIAFDHIRNRVYVACGDNNFYQLNISTGQVVSLKDRIPADQFGNKRFNAVAVDPIDPTIVYLGSHRDIYSTDVALVRSINAGLTWQVLTVAPRHNNSQYGVTGGYEANVIRVNPATRSLYVGTNCFGNWKFGPPAARLPSSATKPDIIITDVSYTNLQPAVNDSLQIILSVTNRGLAATNVPVTVDVKIDSVQFARVTTTGVLQPGETATVVTNGLPWTALAGSHTFLANADPDGGIDEQSELNNSNASSVRVFANTPLLPPTNLQVLLAEATNLVLTWEKPTGAVVERYDIYRNGLSAGTVTASNTRFIATGLTKNTQYTFFVKAVYESGSDTASNAVTTTTAASLLAVAERATSPVVLDGQLNENWKFSNVLAKIPGSNQSSDNFTTFALLWDSANLYVAAKVLDTNLTTRPTYSAGDGLDLFVDGNRSKAIAIFTQDWALRQSINNDTLIAIHPAVTARAGFTSSKTSVIPGGYITEFALPWKYLFNSPNSSATSGSPITFNVGKIIGFDLVNRDNDNTTSLRGAVTWRSGTEREFNEATWGDAILAPAGGDQLPPAAPTSLRADRLYSTSLRLLWNAATDDVGIAEYRVYKNGQLLAGNITTTNYQVIGLTPLTAYQFTIDAIDISGKVSPVSNALSITTPDHLITTAAKITTRPVLDGLLSEADWMLSDTANKVISGTASNKTVFGALWTADTLYVGVRVTDAKLYTNPQQYYNTDAVEVYLDGNQGRTASYDADDRQFIKVYNGGLFGSNQTGVVSKWAATDSGYSVEMAIPWSNIGVSATENKVIGFDIANNDDDAGTGRTNQNMWNGNDNNYLTSMAFGRLKLGAFPTVTLTSLCSDKPDSTRKWRVRSTYNIPVNYTWDVYGTLQQGSGTLPANGTVILETITTAGANTLRLNYLDKTVAKASGGAACAPNVRLAAVGNEPAAEAAVYPTHSKGQFTIRYSSPISGSVQCRVVNELGQEMYQQRFVVVKGNNLLPVNMRVTYTGMHVLSIIPVNGKMEAVKLYLDK